MPLFHQVPNNVLILFSPPICLWNCHLHELPTFRCVYVFIHIYIYYIFICFHYGLYTNVYVTIFICIHVCVCVHPPSCVSLSNSASYNMSIQIYAVMYVSTTLFMKSCVFFHLWRCTNLLTYYSMYISILFQTIFGIFNKCNDSV